MGVGDVLGLKEKLKVQNSSPYIGGRSALVEKKKKRGGGGKRGEKNADGGEGSPLCHYQFRFYF